MALSRNPDAVAIFSDAAVYVGKTLTPTRPATIADPFDVTWDNAGILNGDSGITNPREWDVTEHMGWGIGLYRKGYKNFKESRVWTCLESNSTTRRIAHPGSTATNIVVPRPGRFMLAFEFTNDFGVPERWFPVRPAQCWIPNLDRNESDPTNYEVTSDIFADGSGLLYVRQYTPVNEAQLVTVENATDGTFTLALGDLGPTAALDHDIAVAALQAALEAILGAGNVTVGGTVGAYAVTLSGVFAGEPNPLLTANGSSLVGTGAAVTVEPAP
ncbi:hypothetical protein F5X71_00390 [Nocardia brasiliensis]|uniref:Uncharacterized protein n=1 Tax=Nocardia brasiliensis TaxID=37326 RepID=A0A6G9XJG5_NOCBR|nr:hypothetical protein [Nocardia brasiliensis]QIS00990.1 hypothetical protein F5X71_00390 [Nocardia brasiliensis]